MEEELKNIDRELKKLKKRVIYLESEKYYKSIYNTIEINFLNELIIAYEKDSVGTLILNIKKDFHKIQKIKLRNG